MKINEIITRNELGQVGQDIKAATKHWAPGVAKTASAIRDKVRDKVGKVMAEPGVRQGLSLAGDIIKSPLTAYRGLSTGYEQGAAAASSKGISKEPKEKPTNQPQQQQVKPQQPEENLDDYIRRIDSLDKQESGKALALIAKKKQDGSSLPADIDAVIIPKLAKNLKT